MPVKQPITTTPLPCKQTKRQQKRQDSTLVHTIIPANPSALPYELAAYAPLYRTASLEAVFTTLNAELAHPINSRIEFRILAVLLRRMFARYMDIYRGLCEFNGKTVNFMQLQRKLLVLASYGYIVKSDIYYSITLSGRIVLDRLNELLSKHESIQLS